MGKLTKEGALSFLVGCLGARLSIAALAYYLPPKWLRLMGVGALALVVGWAYIYLFNARPSGGEVGGLDTPAQKVWWNSLRPLHAGLYLAFALMAFKESPYAYRIILADVAVGLVAWLNNYWGQL